MLAANRSWSNARAVFKVAKSSKAPVRPYNGWHGDDGAQLEKESANIKLRGLGRAIPVMENVHPRPFLSRIFGGHIGGHFLFLVL